MQSLQKFACACIQIIEGKTVSAAVFIFLGICILIDILPLIERFTCLYATDCSIR